MYTKFNIIKVKINKRVDDRPLRLFFLSSSESKKKWRTTYESFFDKKGPTNL